jgi:hypothetical protein
MTSQTGTRLKSSDGLPDQARFVFEFDQKSLRGIALVLFVALWGYTAIMTLPFSYSMPVNDLDGSHKFGSNYFPDAGFRYGSDLIFTFGPLGYLVNPENIGNHIVITNVFRGAVWLLLLIHLILLCRLGINGFYKSIVLMCAIVSAHTLLLGLFDYFAIAVLLVMVVYMVDQPLAWLAPVSIVLITAILALTKFTAYVLALSSVALLLATRARFPQKLVGRRELYLSLAALIALPCAFFLHNPSFGALFNYLHGSLELASGYNEAMSIPTGANELFYAVIMGSLFVVGVIYASVKGALNWTVAPILLGYYWLIFKHGFVRADAHVCIAFFFEIVLAAVLICLLRRGSGLIAPYLSAFPLFVIVALSGAGLYFPVWTDGFWSTASTRQMARDLMDWDHTAKRIADETNKNDEFQKLPEKFRSRLQESTATVLPWELSYARSGRFKLQPLYTMQAYSAYTEYLDRKTAEHLRAGRDQSEYVLFEWEALEGRHPLLDVPLTWMAMADNYEPAEASEGKVLLKRRQIPLTHRQRVVQDIALPIGQWVRLPDTQTELWGKIRIPYSAFGAFRKDLYKANAIHLTVASDEVTATFRIIPAVVGSPFPLKAFPTDLKSFVNVLDSKRVQQPITRIRLESDSPGDYGEPTLQLLEETETELTWNKPAEKASFQTEFHLVSPSAIANLSTGGLDLIDDIRDARPFTSDQHPYVIKSDLVLAGWLADRTDGRSFDKVYAVVDGLLYPATVQPRQDVGAYFHNPALDSSGFRVLIGVGDFRQGIQRIDLIGVMDHAVYRYPSSLYAELR